jgi:hypothetical protein
MKRNMRWSAGKLSAFQQRFEESILGEVVLSGLVAVILVIGVVWNLPDSQTRDELRPIVKPVAAATGFDQQWGIYAPNPPSRIRTLEVHVTMADGTMRIRTFQPGDRIIGAFSSIHWKKLMAEAADEAKLRRSIARWVTDEMTEPPERAIRIEMILLTESLQLPGDSTPGTIRTKTVYRHDFGKSQ